MQTRLSGLICMMLLGYFCSLPAQIDTTVYKLETIVVTGDRAEHTLKEATTPVSVLNEEEIRSLPARNLVDLLSHVAGLDFVDQDGNGLLPMPVVRGFFGGGESEYVLLIVDGVARNDLRSGLVNWNAVAVEDIQRIEVSRGGGSAVYGDQAIGAVIHVETVDGERERFIRSNLTGGTSGSRGANLQTGFSSGNNNFSLTLSGSQSDGFRDHSEWTNAEARLKYQRKFGYRSRLTTSVDVGRLDKDEPGPLTRSQLDENRVQSQSLFAKDNRLRNRINVATHLFKPFSDLVSFTGSAGLNYLGQEQTRTIQVASNFGNTQRKEESNLAGWTQLQFRAKQGKAEWIAGIDADLGSYDHDYFTSDTDSLLSGGKGKRIRVGSYLENRTTLTKRLRSTIGLRADWLANSNDDNLSEENAENNFGQLSPRIGFNYQYSKIYLADGHLFMNWARAFKAPTLDQLYDRRVLDLTSVFGAAFNFSNDGLKPQRSSNFDVGIYQQIPLGGKRHAGLSLAAYWLDIDNEIDLDLSTFKYGNILESRHRGLESELSVHLSEKITFQNTINYTDAVFNAGKENESQIKNVPEWTSASRVTVRPLDWTNLTVSHRFFGEVYLDDANSFTLPSFQILDAQLLIQWKQVGLQLKAMNLLDKEYNSSGYVFFDNFIQDNVEFLYPARCRYLEAGIRYSR